MNSKADVAKVEDVGVSPTMGFPLRYNKGSMLESVVVYRNPLATQKIQYPRLSRRVNNRKILWSMIEGILSI